MAANNDALNRYPFLHAHIAKEPHVFEVLDEAEESADAPDLPLWLLTVQCGQEVGRAYLAWCDRADAVIAALPEPDPALDAGESRGRNS